MKIDVASLTVGLALGAIGTVVVGRGLLLGLASRIQKRKRAALGSPFCPVVGDDAIGKVLKRVRQKHAVPAMAAAVVTSEGIRFVGAVGVRKRGTEVAVTLDDLWHLGSDGKAMTSTMIARFVERGLLKWESGLSQFFPELAAGMNPGFQKVTLLELLSHRAGLPANVELVNYLGDDDRELRLRVVREELAKKPRSTPGSHYAYSNVGYMIAGAVVERVAGQSWEECMRKELFKPLQMESAGFGGMGTAGNIDQPWPHTKNGLPTSENGPRMDNPPVMGPAGRIHCSMRDWARFIQDQLRGARGESALLKAESYKVLQTPPNGGDYVLGWKVVQRGWAGGVALNHAGDNTMNFANVWIAPRRDWAFLVAVNQSGAFKATDEAIAGMIDLMKQA